MDRKCLVCETPVSVCRLGIDACRACAVFYKRAQRSGERLVCNGQREGDCARNGRILDCRGCRFKRMKAIFDEDTLEINFTNRSNPLSETESIQGSEQPTSNTRPSEDNALIGCLSSSPSSRATPVLERIRNGYSVMTRVRKISELSLRPMSHAVHPSGIDEDSYENIATTQEVMLRTRRILVSAVFDFASIAFPDFVALSKEEKWRLVSGSNERVNTLESAYRAAKIYPDDGRIFTSYTTTLSTNLLEGCVIVCPPNVDVSAAKREMGKMLDENVRNSKREWKKVNPTNDEFLFMIALSFWNTSDESLSQLTNKNRASIMQDLHSHYTSRGVSDYAMRIGELFSLMVANERVVSTIKEDFSVFGQSVNHQQVNS